MLNINRGMAKLMTSAKMSELKTNKAEKITHATAITLLVQLTVGKAETVGCMGAVD